MGPVFSVDMRLKFNGELAETGEIDFYDVAQALEGFQRSLALTTHLIVNGEIITQAPSLKKAKIIVAPPAHGSWEVIATIIGGIGYLGTRPKDTPVGHLIHSAYDYVLKNAFGIKLDYEKSLGEVLEKQSQTIGRNLNQGRLDDLTEKCETAIKNMHRPIVRSKTAKVAQVERLQRDSTSGPRTNLSEQTFEALDFERRSTTSKVYEGLVSSYNINTKKGRFYILDLSRTVPFILSESLSGRTVSMQIAQNMERLAEGDLASSIKFGALENQSRSGRMKSLFVVSINN